MAARDPSQIRSDIEQTRERLGETVEALAHKTDVKTQAKARVEETRQRFRRTAGEARAKMTGTATDARTRLAEASPEQAKDAAASAAQTARRRPVPFALAAAFGLGLFVGVLVRRR